MRLSKKRLIRMRRFYVRNYKKFLEGDINQEKRIVSNAIYYQTHHQTPQRRKLAIKREQEYYKHHSTPIVRMLGRLLPSQGCVYEIF